ncbi:beta-ketoacyl-ACP synthase III [Phycisphaera mikurensis]|uniref:Beta-ketoacyl-[acyl-carrier-protein] synthase III n=1 Tax=Phycisphaera mikurensis (strain NBRC 102666 / KCTC 22515 / FYK2301M01) TaxID=1142394 RepID=I0IF49_PHYMF|nr:beta-ketoacyl-ACP synthase III [Phycisphaera mikurensis]MBB6440717.1 3-oxoacyl-[acyl-carrier-protein] synthase-3 [Phycisphaera mikurensis]BAM03887.1 3-oxoacyl-[acyl-carrier-protein] synthase III [Phycisphaera mikurensis NBRC 102666]
MPGTAATALEGHRGVRIAGTGVGLAGRVVTNEDLAARVDTTDPWIRQRTGIHQRRYAADDQSLHSLSLTALRNALDDAGLRGADLDLVIVATITPAMACPSTAARLADAVGATPAGAFDLAAACSGFVYGMNLAAASLQTGMYRHVAVVGAEVLSRHVNPDDRRTCILFGDGAGAAILSADQADHRGVLHQSMGSDGGKWGSLYMPRRESDLPEGIDASDTGQPGWNGAYDTLQMQGQEVFKFAVIKTCDMIEQSLAATGLRPADLKLVIPHQSNQRIMATAADRFGLPPEKMYINIDRHGNTSAASVPLCLEEVRRSGRVDEGDLVLFLAIGGGMTWATSLWRL